MNNMDVIHDNDSLNLDLDIDSHLKTLGEFIRYHREQKQFSLEELSMKTKIRIQQLINLEENNFPELPNAVYLKGFIKSICNELDVNVELALKYLNENTIAEEALEFLSPGKEIKPLRFNFKFFEKSGIQINQKMLVGSVILVSLAGSFIGHFKSRPKNIHAEPAIVHKQMNIFEARKLTQQDAVTELTPPESSGFPTDRIIPEGEAIAPDRMLLNNDMLEGKKVVSETVATAAPVAAPVAVVATKVVSPKIVAKVAPAPAPVVVHTKTAVETPEVTATATTTTDSITAEEPAVTEVAVTEAAVTEATTIAPTKLTVKAKKGTAFLVYRVNGGKKVKIYLRHGKTLELEGNDIRMDVGNPGAVEFTKNGEPLEVSLKPGHESLRLEFPEI